VESCKTCSVLDYVDSPMAESSTRMPQLVVSLKQRFGPSWTGFWQSEAESRPTTGRETFSIKTTAIVINTSLFDRCKQKVFVEFCIEIGARFLFEHFDNQFGRKTSSALSRLCTVTSGTRSRLPTHVRASR
jgi:hypothetical protein